MSKGHKTWLHEGLQELENELEREEQRGLTEVERQREAEAEFGEAIRAAAHKTQITVADDEGGDAS